MNESDAMDASHAGAGPDTASVPASDVTEKRRIQREKIKAHARFRETGASAFEVELTDLSMLGFCMTTFGRPAVGTHIWVQLPGLRSMEAVIRRTNGNDHGCEFIQPLHPSVSDYLIREWGQ
jgi:hypothetical protein